MQYYISNIIFLFYSIRYLNAVKYTRRLSTEFPPELRRVPGLIESTGIGMVWYRQEVPLCVIKESLK